MCVSHVRSRLNHNHLYATGVSDYLPPCSEGVFVLHYLVLWRGLPGTADKVVGSARCEDGGAPRHMKRPAEVKVVLLLRPSNRWQQRCTEDGLDSHMLSLSFPLSLHPLLSCSYAQSPALPVSCFTLSSSVCWNQPQHQW